MSQQTPRVDSFWVIDISENGRKSFARTLELECARLAQEKAELVKTLEAMLDANTKEPT